MSARAAAVAIAIAAVLFAPPARSQCGAKRSTCSGCHDDTHAAFARAAPWHADHAFADLCSTCHAGSPDVGTAAGAHAGLVSPLARDGEQCRQCHGEGSLDRAHRYVAAAAQTPPAPPRFPSLPPSPSAPPDGAPPASRVGDTLATILACAFAAAALAWLSRREPVLQRIVSRLRSPSWSPYLGGFLLGLVVAVSMSFFGHRLSGAGAYQHLSGYAGARLAPLSMYWRHVVPTGITWDVLVAIGALAGAFVSSRFSRTFRIRTMPDAGWTEVYGSSVVVRWLVAFVGSMLTEIGAGTAGGCTASLAISGGAALAPGAFLFMIGMFAGGAPALALVTALRRRRR